MKTRSLAAIRARRVFVVALALFSLALPWTALAAWQRVDAETVPSGGHGQAVVRVEDGFLIFRQHSASVPEVYSYTVHPTEDVDSHKICWVDSTSPEVDVRFETGTAATWDGARYVYILPGSAYHRDRYAALRFDTTTATFEDFVSIGVELPDGRLAGAQGARTTITYVESNGERYLYAVIGRARQQVRPVARWQPTVMIRLRLGDEVDEWELVSSFEEAFWLDQAEWFCTDDGASLIHVENHLYFLSGSDCQDWPTRTFARYSLADGQWESLECIRASIGANDGASLAWDGGQHIYAVVGGHCELKKGAAGREFLRYDLNENEPEASRWSVLQDLPIPLGEFPGNRMAIAGQWLFLWQGTNSTCFGDPVPGAGHALYRIILSKVTTFDQILP